MTKPSLRGRRLNWVVKPALVLSGALLGLLLAQGAISLFPWLLPRFLRPDAFALREHHPDDEEVIFRVSDADLFVAQQGSITPPSNPDEVLARYEISFDEDGFRRPYVEADSYPVIALGDSFTEGANVPKPWPDVLADELYTPVKNLGFKGYGPPDYAQVMHLFGTREAHDWVVIGFLESNDMRDPVKDQTPFTLPRVLRGAVEATRGKYREPDYGKGPWKYPIDMQLGDQTRPLAFFEPDLWVLNGMPETYANSFEMGVLGGDLESIRQDAGDACVLLAFFPGKPHIYFPYVTDPEDQVDVLENARRVDLDKQERIFTYPVPTTFDEIVSRMDSMSVAVGNAARQEGVHFLDVTPYFEEAAARGEETFYTYDSHWNQLGHDIAGKAIADYIRAHPECGTSNH